MDDSDETHGPSLWKDPYFRALPATGKLAYIYIASSALIGRDYVSLSQMARDTDLSEDLCENYVAKFNADWALPRLTVVEEVRE